MVTGKNSLIVTLSCENQPGIVHAITGSTRGECWYESQQFDSPNSGVFYASSSPRTVWSNKPNGLSPVWWKRSIWMPMFMMLRKRAR